MTGQMNSKEIMLGLTVHQLSASTEISTILAENDHVASYNDIRLQNESLGKNLVSTDSIYNYLERKTPHIQV